MKALLSYSPVTSYSFGAQVATLLQIRKDVIHRWLTGNPAYKDQRFDHFKANLDYFVKELGRVGVTKQLLWEEYRSDYPAGYSHSQFCHHLLQQMIARKPSMVLQHRVGEKLFIDFAGKKQAYINSDS